jgi:outer membrane lipoprotein LolB
MRYAKYFALLVVALAFALTIAGCATHPVSTVGTGFTDPSQLQHWSAQGRMGITGVSQGGSGNFSWQQRDDVSNVNLRGPLGAGSIAITLDNTLHVTTANGVRYDADAALNELETRLGTPVPVRQLSYWLRGIPAKGDYQWLNDAEKKVLQQDGWLIEYAESMFIGTLQLPKKITATHGAVRIRAVIEEWTLD